MYIFCQIYLYTNIVQIIDIKFISFQNPHMAQDYSILAASEFSGVSTETIRAWERRYQAVQPKRLGNGRRVYTSEDVAKLKILNKLTHEGHPISHIASLSLNKLNHIHTHQISKTHPLTIEAMEELHEFNLERLSEVLEKAKLVLDTKSFVLDFASPLMAEVGKRVENKKLSIAQEHILSSTLRSHFGTLLQISSVKKTTRNFIFTTPEGDFHEFGILLCAVLCLTHRIGIHYLGPNLPAQELIKAAAQLKPTAIVIGTTLLPKELRKINLGDYFGELTKEISPKITIYTGGEAYQPKRSKHIHYIPSLSAFDKTLGSL